VPIEAPYFSYEQLREQADGFLDRYHHSRVIPVPIEEIVEFSMGLDVVPVPGLH